MTSSGQLRSKNLAGNGSCNRDLCCGLAQLKSGSESNHNTEAGPEVGSSCQMPIQPHSTVCVLQGGVGKSPTADVRD